MVKLELMKASQKQQQFLNIIVNEHTSLINEYIQIQNQTYQDISKIVTLLEFFKANLIAQLNITIKIVDQIEQDFFELIDYCQIEWLVFLTIMLWLIIFFLILQINHWQEPYKYMQISEKDIELTISKTLYLIDRITNNPHQIKNINYFRGCFLNQKQSMTFQSVKISEISKSNQNVKTSQQKPKKSSRIQDTSFSILNIRIILLILWLILSGLVLSAFIILVKNMQDSQPELRLTMQFVKFKENLDGIMILCYLLKNQQSLIQQTIQTFTLNSELKNEDGYFQIQYQELLKQFNPMFLEMDEIYSNIYQDVIASYKINSVNKNHLINLYEQDLCQIIPNILPFCAYENGSFLYFPNYPSATSLSNNQQIYKYGINGIYQQIISIFNTHYTLEKIGIEDQNMTNNILFLGNPEFIQTILPYFFDISYAILEFYYTIINSTLDILESDYEMVLQFYISAGIACLLILCTVILIRAITLQRKVRLILQSIILLPYESLQDQSILISIRKIDRNL